MKKKSALAQILLNVLMIIVCAIMIGPFIWMVLTSLKTLPDVNRFPPIILPDPPQWNNYVRVFTEQPTFLFIANSVKITSMVMAGQMFFCSITAYAFARIPFKGRDTIFLIYISAMMIPSAITMIPVYKIFSGFKMIDSHWPLILGGFFSIYGVFLLKAFFVTLPKDLEEAAEIDGCNPFQTYSRIMLPLIKPALATLMVFCFMGVWNDFINPLIYLTSPRKFTMPVGLSFFKNTYVILNEWNIMMACAVIAVVPTILIYLFAQRYFVEGVASAGIKG